MMRKLLLGLGLLAASLLWSAAAVAATESRTALIIGTTPTSTYPS